MTAVSTAMRLSKPALKPMSTLAQPMALAVTLFDLEAHALDRVLAAHRALLSRPPTLGDRDRIPLTRAKGKG